MHQCKKKRFKCKLKLILREYEKGETDLEAIKLSLVRYDGHLAKGLPIKVYSYFVLIKESMEGEYIEKNKRQCYKRKEKNR
ncbi:MAG: hypothetical protein N4A64_02675 [Marinisporobacter sp.]|jgi:hypothetical protein|nr:hypothetical protein [Marinisporobacter sp.]